MLSGLGPLSLIHISCQMDAPGLWTLFYPVPFPMTALRKLSMEDMVGTLYLRTLTHIIHHAVGSSMRHWYFSVPSPAAIIFILLL